MIIVKTPFRISFVGGGSDMAPFYTRHGAGAVVSAAIDKYMYIMIHPYFHKQLRFKYSRTEDVDDVNELKHPIARECLRLMGISHGFEITSVADIPAGLGVGSSSSFTVCLLHALHAIRSSYISRADLAELACKIEIETLGEPIGKQDQYAASYGGVNHIRFNSDSSVEVESLMLNREIMADFERRLVVFYVGQSRNARDILSEQSRATSEGDNRRDLEELVRLADDLRSSIVQGKLKQIGEILHEGWLKKRELAPNITNERIDGIYETGLKAGGAGGKLLGAGGGGFMLFYCEPEHQDSLRNALQLRELPIRFEREGSKVIYCE